MGHTGHLYELFTVIAHYQTATWMSPVIHCSCESCTGLKASKEMASYRHIHIIHTRRLPQTLKRCYLLLTFPQFTDDRTSAEKREYANIVKMTVRRERSYVLAIKVRECTAPTTERPFN